MVAARPKMSVQSFFRETKPACGRENCVAGVQWGLQRAYAPTYVVNRGWVVEGWVVVVVVVGKSSGSAKIEVRGRPQLCDHVHSFPE